MGKFTVGFFAPAERLKHAVYSMAQMQAKKGHTDQIHSTNCRVRKPDDHHVVNIVAMLGIMQSPEVDMLQIHGGSLNGVMKKVIKDESENDQPAHHHGARGVTGGDRLRVRIGNGPSSLVFSSQAYGGPDMQADHDQQPDSGGPNDLHVRLEKMAVAIDGLRPEKNLKITQQVGDNEEEHGTARDCHDVFFSERGVENSSQNHVIECGA
jgi:hypothetical protein